MSAQTVGVAIVRDEQGKYWFSNFTTKASMRQFIDSLDILGHVNEVVFKLEGDELGDLEKKALEWADENNVKVYDLHKEMEEVARR